MASYPSVILQFAAASAVAAMLSMSTPVVATEIIPGARTSAPATIKHHVLRHRTWMARHHHHVNPVVSHLGCSGEWCGRQFVTMVLMTGVGF
jgi:hypothetical protein